MGCSLAQPAPRDGVELATINFGQRCGTCAISVKMSLDRCLCGLPPRRNGGKRWGLVVARGGEGGQGPGPICVAWARAVSGPCPTRPVPEGGGGHFHLPDLPDRPRTPRLGLGLGRGEVSIPFLTKPNAVSASPGARRKMGGNKLLRPMKLPEHPV